MPKLLSVCRGGTPPTEFAVRGFDFVRRFSHKLLHFWSLFFAVFQTIPVPKTRSTILAGRLWSLLATKGNHIIIQEICLQYVDLETWKLIELFYFRQTKLRLHLESLLTNVYAVSFAVFRYNKRFTCQGDDCNKLGEGCFCPENTTLFSSTSDLCVPSCKATFVLM